MRFILLVTAWSSAAFVPAFLVAHPWQRLIGAIAVRVLAVFGLELEIVDLELFFPFDIAVFVGLCLASTWTPWGRRLRTLAAGIPVLVVIEVLSVVLALYGLVVATSGPDATAAAFHDAQRFAIGVIRVVGLVAAAGVWFYLLGRERLSLAARTWLGA